MQNFNVQPPEPTDLESIYILIILNPLETWIIKYYP